MSCKAEETPANQGTRDRRAYFVGILLLFAAAVLWSLAGPGIKLVNKGGDGPHAVVIAFYRSLFAGLILFPFARGKFHTLRRRDRISDGTVPDTQASRQVSSGHSSQSSAEGFLFLSLRPAAVCCVVFFTLMTICFVLATTLTEAGNAIILQYTSAFWIFALSPLLLGETPRGGSSTPISCCWPR
jgi:drug/metabolite transporter (DMT)-like permease